MQAPSHNFLITPKYTATAKMYMISASSGSVLDLSDFNIGTSLSQDYTELIKIRPVFNEVIDNLNLDMEYEDLLKKVSISVVGDSRLLAVSVEDNDPKLAQSMVNELVDTAVTYIPKVMNASENAQPTICGNMQWFQMNRVRRTLPKILFSERLLQCFL